MKGIETIFAGVRFRSRLEARWAAFMSALSIRWEYEPFDCAGYIPDFMLHGARPTILDIKPIAHFSELHARVEVVRKFVPKEYAVVAIGVSPFLAGKEYTDSFGVMFDEGDEHTEPSRREAWLSRCPMCERWGVYNTRDVFNQGVLLGKHSRTCGHFAEHWHDPAYMGGGCGCIDLGDCEHTNTAVIHSAWALAIDQVRWVAGGRR